jgi:membrane protein required for beta-lactamase induction
VIAAYLVFLVVVLGYVAIMAYRLTATERELERLRRELDRRAAREEHQADSEPVP